MIAGKWFVGSAASLALVAGCAQLAGIDDTSGAARGGNTVTLVRTSIGTRIAGGPVDVSDLEASYLVPDDSAAGFDRVPAEGGPLGWRGDLATPAAVQLTVPEVPPEQLIVDLDTTGLLVPFDVLEHPGRTPAPAPATIHLDVALDAMTAGTELFQIFTVGSWSSRTLTGAEQPMAGALELGPLSYDFATSRSESGRAALDKLTRQDAYLVLRSSSGQLTGLAEAAPFDQTGDDTVNATMAPVVADRTLDVRVDPAALARRYAEVQPAVDQLEMTWSLTAAPGFAQSHATGPTLYSGTLADSDIGVNVTYGNPFAERGWREVFTLTTRETRVYTPPGTATPATLVASMTELVLPEPGLALALAAPLPSAITIAGTALTSDGVAIPAPTALVEVTFVADAGPLALYSVQVIELVHDPATSSLVPRRTLTAIHKLREKETKPTFQLPPETFQPGHLYTLRAIAQPDGYPNLKDGDLVNRTLPMSQSFVDSAVFSVTP